MHRTRLREQTNVDVGRAHQASGELCSVRIASRDASTQIGNLADALDFSQPNAGVTNLPLPSAPKPVPCFSSLLGLASTNCDQRESMVAFT
jgi:hypothetical protein